MELMDLWDEWDLWEPDCWETGDPESWDDVDERLSVIPPPPVRIHPDDLAAMAEMSGRRGRNDAVHQGRPYAPLQRGRVLAAMGLLQKRMAAQDRIGRERLPAGLGLSCDAIAREVGLPRDRVRQIQALRDAGWDPRESHPDFPAKPGFVHLPTIDEVRRLGQKGTLRG